MSKRGFQFMGAVLLLAVFAMAQAGPRITGVNPATCKVGDTLTVLGESLGGDSVEVMLSREGRNYPAEVVEQTTDKIVMKVPQVRPATYNLALKVDESIYVEPVQVTVQ